MSEESDPAFCADGGVCGDGDALDLDQPVGAANRPGHDQVDGDSVNKGMLTNSYENYQPLMDAMKRINTRVYDLIEFFDGTDFTTG